MSTEKDSSKKGVFFVIATPIGNLADITVRAKEVIADLDCLYAEDTRHTAQLCRHLGVSPALHSLHEHNEEGRISEILARLVDGQRVGLVSDAGTPLISDPGYRIVAACHRAGYAVSPVPGASAVLACLSVCGLPTDKFTFRGFLPAKSVARCHILKDVSSSPVTQVFFESKHRVLDTLADMCAVLGADRKICIARELTKTFETVLLGEVGDLLSRLEANPQWQKGEFVLVVAGAQETEMSFSVEIQSLLLSVADELAPRKAVAIVAKHSGVDKKILYNWLVEQSR